MHVWATGYGLLGYHLRGYFPNYLDAAIRNFSLIAHIGGLVDSGLAVGYECPMKVESRIFGITLADSCSRTSLIGDT
jgi:hypothetical protein